MIDETKEFGRMPHKERLTIVAGWHPSERGLLLRPPYIAAAAQLRADKPGDYQRFLDRLDGWPDRDNFHEMVVAKKVAPSAALLDDLPIIKIMPQYLTDNLNEAEVALRKAGANVYQSTGRLVQLIHHNKAGESEPCTEETETPVGDLRRPDGALIVADIAEPLLVEYLGQSARWKKYDARRKPKKPAPDNPDQKGAWVSTSPPPAYARHLIARGQWSLRILRGTVEAPTLRQDGSLLQKPGYDFRSHLFFDPNGMTFPAIPKQPTRDDSQAALAALMGPLKDFPFVPDDEGEPGGPSAARSVALSCLLTGLVRRSIATAPAHAIDAPVMGTGKTKIAEIASVLATGHLPTAISQGKTEEEFNKRLFSVLLSGDAVIIIDNIEQEIASDEFCSVLTSQSHKNRILGLSRMATVATNSLFILNGNRMTFKGDITDRVVICNIDAQMEDPKTRVFDREPVAYTLAHRAELVTAGLTVLRAHAAAGYPGMDGLSPSRFPDWDRMVRAALVWLGEPDPQVTRQRIAEIDPVRDIHSTLLRRWEEGIGPDVRITAQQVLDRARITTDLEADAFTWPADAWWRTDSAAQLLQAVSDALEGKALNAKRLGKYLMKFESRVYEGLAIRALPSKKTAATFWLRKM